MKAWPTDCRQRATAYLTDPAGRLLVFDHVGNPGSGTQVPAGGIKSGERAEDAVLRELVEESGIEDAVLVRKLGETWSVADPVASAEQIQHAFHLRVEESPLEQAWEWDECSGGAVALHRFALRWATLDEAASQLWPIQAMWLEPLRLSLRETRAESSRSLAAMDSPPLRRRVTRPTRADARRHERPHEANSGSD